MSKTTKILSLLVFIGIAAAGIYLWMNRETNGSPFGTVVSAEELQTLKTAYPDLASYVDDIGTWQGRLAEAKEKGDLNLAYLGLGLAWKSFADRTLSVDHYAQALQVYAEGVEKTGRDNTVLLSNAGSMAAYTGDYARAEAYYKESLALAPGDSKAYLALADLYEYKMGKPAAEILAFLDHAIDTVVTPVDLTNHRRAFLERHPEVQP